MVDVKFEPIFLNIGEISEAAFLRAGSIVLDSHMAKVQDDVSKYPPPGPTYVRTNTLFTSWHRDIDVGQNILGGFTGGISVTLWNDAQDKYGRAYARFVHGDSQGLGQRAINASKGWVNLIQTHNARRSQLVDALNDMMQSLLKAAHWQ